jgi:hypothetical protein
MKTPRIIGNWKSTLKYAWSIKFAVLSGVCSAGEVVITYFPDSLPRGAMAGFAGAFALIGIISRFIMQKEMSDDS